MSAPRMPRGITATPNGTLQIAFTVRGQHFRERLKLKPNRDNIAFAQRKRSAVLHAIECGRFVFSEHFPHSPRAHEQERSAVPTVREALRAYLRQRRRTLAHSTWRDYRSAVNAHLIPAFGAQRLDELTVSAVREWIAATGISTRRVNTVLTPLRSVYADAIADERIDRNPLELIRLPRGGGKPANEPDPLTPAEVRRLLAACAPIYRRFVACAIGTGLRTGELLALEWRDVDFDNGVLHVRRALVAGRTKGPKTAAGNRTVALMPIAAAALKEAYAEAAAPEGRIWRHPSTGRPFSRAQQVRRLWRTACKRAGIRYRPQYQSRHTYASWALSAGEDVSWIARQLGHSDSGTTRRVYARWIPEIRPDAGRRAAALFTALAQDPVASTRSIPASAGTPAAPSRTAEARRLARTVGALPCQSSITFPPPAQP